MASRSVRWLQSGYFAGVHRRPSQVETVDDAALVGLTKGTEYEMVLAFPTAGTVATPSAASVGTAPATLGSTASAAYVQAEANAARLAIDAAHARATALAVDVADLRAKLSAVLAAVKAAGIIA